MSANIIIFTIKITNRLQYTVDWVFNNQLGSNIKITTDENEYLNSELPKINYSPQPMSKNEIWIKPHALLFEYKTHDFTFSSLSDFNDDPLALIFFLLSRYEEYTAPPSVMDAHGRYSARVSFSKKNNILYQPIVNQQVVYLKNKIAEKFLHIIFKKQEYQFQPTFDIDMAWRYRNKGFWRTGGGVLKDIFNLNFKNINHRQKVLRGVLQDPDDTYDIIFKMHKGVKQPPIFFWLLGDYAKYDDNIDVKNIEFQRLIKNISEKYAVGIHPSYRSNQAVNFIKKEKARLEKMIGMSVTKSRQHFLKLRFPETYRRLLEVSISDDYSMGYADDIGFRAGTATPFPWYDIENEAITHLIIHPFQLMDVTLKDYLKLTPDQAINNIQQIKEAIKAVGGTFTTLWHNPSVSDTGDWKNWLNVYENCLE
jgi:hypothetical protein